MNSISITRRTGITAIAIGLAGAALAVGSPGAALGELPPPWQHCAYADYPAAADLGPLLSPYTVPSDELRAILLGEVTVGTDCSMYDPMLPMPTP